MTTDEHFLDDGQNQFEEFLAGHDARDIRYVADLLIAAQAESR